MKIFFAYTSFASFVERDLRILKERHEVGSSDIHHLNPLRHLANFFLLARSELLFIWFASLHALPYVLAAKLMGKKVVTVVGGYEAANIPEIQYGSARSRVKRIIIRMMLKSSTAILAVSRSSQQQIVDNLGIDPSKIDLVYHGFELYPPQISSSRAAVVVTVGQVTRQTYLLKGFADFFGLARALPEVEFWHVGAIKIDLLSRLGKPLPGNIKLRGELPHEELQDLLGHAKIYLQLSRHESFGCSVAEAMLSGCIPVVTDSFALPEVVGDCGIIVGSRDTGEIVSAVRRALAMPGSEGERARRRIIETFSYVKRRDSLLRILERLVKR